MKTTIAYWAATTLVAAVMLFSAINFNLAHPFGPFAEPFPHLGLPDYFRIELTIAKIIGVLALVLPGTPPRVRDFAYFGFGLTLLSASIAHYSVGDPVAFVIDPLLIGTVLAASYLLLHRRRAAARVTQHGGDRRTRI